jgi:FkbM family methyltransferase
MLKAAVAAALARLGYQVIPMPPPNDFPYVRKISVQGVSFDFWIANQTGREWYDYDHESLNNLEPAALKDLIGEGDRVLEIGAHHGFFTTLIGKLVGSKGSVLGVEAFPFNAMVAQANVSMNGLGGHVHVVHAAGGDRSGTVEIMHDSNTVVSEGAHAGELRRRITVPRCTGDELDAKYGPFNVIKCDVEGYEEFVLRGCQEILKRRPKLALEIHAGNNLLGAFGSSVKKIHELIGAERYQGKMFLKSNPSQLLNFSPATVPHDSDSNVFILPNG